jgi:NTE family protein
LTEDERKITVGNAADGTGDSQPKIGLCVSGGGFRAAFYALGAFRYLAEANLLPAITAVSAVSGGSIAAAKVASEWDTLRSACFSVETFCEVVETPMRAAVARSNLRNVWLGRALTGRGIGRGGRGIVLGEVLRESLGLPVFVAELPEAPQVIFTSTCLQTGRAFRISRDFCGSWDHGYAEPTPAQMRLGTALAASAAFPLTLTVVRVASDELDLPRPSPDYLTLVDGGVYDNLGLEWFQGSGSGRPASSAVCDFTVVINASGSLKPTQKVYGAARSLVRDLGIQYSQTLNLRVRWFVDQLMKAPGTGLYIGINRDPRDYKLLDNKTAIDPAFYDGALPSSLARRLPLVRTDLDRFSSDETALLAYHGYWSLHARLKTFRPDLAVATPEWRQFADLDSTEERRLHRILDEAGRVRIAR